DGISGATESSHGWNQAVERSFEKALKVPTEGKYFDGKFAGVDNQSKVLLLVDVDADQVTGITMSLFGTDGKIIANDKLTADQKSTVEKLTAGLLASGVQTADIAGQEAVSAAAKAALTDALANASKEQGAYKDGTFTAYGDAYDKGTREGVQQVDAVSGATSSSNALKAAVDRAYGKAEVVETQKAAYFDGIFIGASADKSVNVMVTTKFNVPVTMVVYYLDANGKVRYNLTDDELLVKYEIENTSNGKSLHKYGYRAAAFGANDTQKALSAKAIEAIKAALETAGK
ncbi:hypothetical protein KC345_g10884, partial [Hortaea werneckii]